MSAQYIPKKIRKLYELALESRNISITDFQALRTHKFDEETNKWVPDSYSVYVMIKNEDMDIIRIGDIEQLLEGLFGFECCINLN